MKQRVQIDFRRGDLIVSSYSRTTAGFWIMNGIYRRLRADATDEELGLAAEEALSATRHEVAVPDPSGPLPIIPVLEELNLSSYSSYIKGVRSVSPRREASVVEIVPTRNDGIRGGFDELVDRTQQLRNPTKHELGAGIRRALTDAT